MKPRIGSPVWYRPRPTDKKLLVVWNDVVQPMAAIVTHVWDDGHVNLAVFDANGVATNRTTVRFCQGDCPPGECQWPNGDQ